MGSRACLAAGGTAAETSSPEKKARRKPVAGLLIEDDPWYARLVRTWIDRASDGAIRLEHSDNLSSGLDRLSREEFDLVLLDLVLPDSSGYETFSAVAKRFPKIPVIVITGMADESLALRALRHGAQDYLVKGRLDGEQLLRSIRFALERKKIVRREEDFFQNVNHELRNPLTSLHTAIVALQDESCGPVNDKQREVLAIAARGVQHLRRMVDDLLDIARADLGKIPFTPRELPVPGALAELAAASAAAAAEKKISIATEIEGDLPPAYADPVRLRQILFNLAGNALKFTPEGGAITLSARVWEKNPSFLLIGVADSGPGISSSEKARIFDRLYQSDPGDDSSHAGLGIGLYICSRLTARHGGKIWVEGSRGHGSCFYFTLPVLPSAAAMARRKTKCRSRAKR